MTILLRAGTFPWLVFAIHCVLSLGFNAYERLDWLDVIMHFLGGAAIADFFFQIIGHLDRQGIMRAGGKAAVCLMVFGLTAASTVIWEFAEFLADAFFNAGSQPGVANTMKDQFMGLIGGIAYLGCLFAAERPVRTNAYTASRLIP